MIRKVQHGSSIFSKQWGRSRREVTYVENKKGEITLRMCEKTIVKQFLHIYLKIHM